MKVLQAPSGAKTHAGWTATIKRQIQRYLARRTERRAFRRESVENKIAAPYEGRRWCDATERELIGDIAKSHGWHF
jgi:hypothetical protein